MQKAKDGGLDVVDTYVFWNVHEPSPGNVLSPTHLWIQIFVNFVVNLFALTCLSMILRGGTISYVS